MRKLILVLNILVMMVCTVWGQSNVWDGKTKEDLTDKGDGVYHISTAAQLAKLAELVNEEGQSFEGMTVILQNNIVLNEKVLDEDGNLNGGSFTEWTPIGLGKHPFQGTFNGNGHKVSGIYVTKITEVQGLFGWLSGGVIENVGVIDSYMSGGRHVGGVCGWSTQGSISNSYNAGLIEGGGSSHVGGVCGWSLFGSITNSYNVGSIEGGIDANVGGVCGVSQSGSISNSYNAGSVTVTATGGSTTRVGGVCGGNFDLSSITNSYNAGQVTGQEASVGSVCGYNTEGAPITGCYYLDNTVDSDKGIGNEEYDKAKTWAAEPDAFAEAVNDGLVRNPATPWIGEATVDDEGYMTFPTLAQEPENENGVYQIFTADELRWFAGKVNANNSDLDGKLMQDIEVSGLKLDEDGKPDDETIPAEEKRWMPIGKDWTLRFEGTFDGNGKTVSGVYIDDDTDDANLGLFGYLGYGGVIENIGVVDNYVKGTGEYASVGGVCGWSEGSISNSYNAGSVTGGEQYLGWRRVWLYL